MLITVAARSKTWACGRSLSRIVVSIPVGEIDVLSVVSAVCCQLEVPVTGRTLIQRSSTECGVSECDRGMSKKRRSWPNK